MSHPLCGGCVFNSRAETRRRRGISGVVRNYLKVQVGVLALCSGGVWKVFYSNLCVSAALRDALFVPSSVRRLCVRFSRGDAEAQRDFWGCVGLVCRRECTRCVVVGIGKYLFQTLRLCGSARGFVCSKLCARLLNSILAQRRRDAEGFLGLFTLRECSRSAVVGFGKYLFQTLRLCARLLCSILCARLSLPNRLLHWLVEFNFPDA